MKRKFYLPLIIILFLAGHSILNAQNLVIRWNNGSENSESLSSLQKLNFADNNLILSFKDGSNDSYPLPELQKLYFGTETDVPESQKVTENRMIVYPNPSDQEIKLQNIPDGTSMISIYRMDGKLVIQRFVSAETALINISSLESGFYLLVANNQTVKFIKR